MFNRFYWQTLVFEGVFPFEEFLSFSHENGRATILWSNVEKDFPPLMLFHYFDA